MKFMFLVSDVEEYISQKNASYSTVRLLCVFYTQISDVS